MISYMLYVAILTNIGEIHAAPVRSFGSVQECQAVGQMAAREAAKLNIVKIARYYCVESTEV